MATVRKRLYSDHRGVRCWMYWDADIRTGSHSFGGIIIDNPNRATIGMRIQGHQGRGVNRITEQVATGVIITRSGTFALPIDTRFDSYYVDGEPEIKPNMMIHTWPA